MMDIQEKIRKKDWTEVKKGLKRLVKELEKQRTGSGRQRTEVGKKGLELLEELEKLRTGSEKLRTEVGKKGLELLEEIENLRTKFEKQRTEVFKDLEKQQLTEVGKKGMESVKEFDKLEVVKKGFELAKEFKKLEKEVEKKGIEFVKEFEKLETEVKKKEMEFVEVFQRLETEVEKRRMEIVKEVEKRVKEPERQSPTADAMNHLEVEFELVYELTKLGELRREFEKNRKDVLRGYLMDGMEYKNRVMDMENSLSGSGEGGLSYTGGKAEASDKYYASGDMSRNPSPQEAEEPSPEKDSALNPRLDWHRSTVSRDEAVMETQDEISVSQSRRTKAADDIITRFPGIYNDPKFEIEATDTDTYVLVLELCVLPWLHDHLPELLGNQIVINHSQGPNGVQRLLYISTPNLLPPDSEARAEILGTLHRLLPKSAIEISVEFCEGGIQSSSGGRNDRYWEVPTMGDSIGARGSQFVGTLGPCLTFGDTMYWMSNEHVFDKAEEDVEVRHPNGDDDFFFPNGSSKSTITLGKLNKRYGIDYRESSYPFCTRSEPLPKAFGPGAVNKLRQQTRYYRKDVRLIHLASEQRPLELRAPAGIKGCNHIKNIERIRPGELIRMTGRTSGIYGLGRVGMLPDSWLEDGICYREWTVEQDSGTPWDEETGIGARGDSGAGIVNVRDNSLCALLWGRNHGDAPLKAYVTDILDLETAIRADDPSLGAMGLMDCDCSTLPRSNLDRCSAYQRPALHAATNSQTNAVVSEKAQKIQRAPKIPSIVIKSTQPAKCVPMGELLQRTTRELSDSQSINDLQNSFASSLSLEEQRTSVELESESIFSSSCSSKSSIASLSTVAFLASILKQDPALEKPRFGKSRISQSNLRLKIDNLIKRLGRDLASEAQSQSIPEGIYAQLLADHHKALSTWVCREILQSNAPPRKLSGSDKELGESRAHRLSGWLMRSDFSTTEGFYDQEERCSDSDSTSNQSECLSDGSDSEEEIKDESSESLALANFMKDSTALKVFSAQLRDLIESGAE
ncbi:hypothetical protein HYFRA_00007825 [Hymenoscyphus fraxineus]|uniref:Uncharacterized protein n=1 Tax=Hymenoscyphus fraxineus TaxID=746836 RepID=A0A9N9KP85_9HELO|nr:hypothetical protein HYFRA_00007825 [Hymenoscyphus fraxineus]